MLLLADRADELRKPLATGGAFDELLESALTRRLLLCPSHPVPDGPLVSRRLQLEERKGLLVRLQCAQLRITELGGRQFERGLAGSFGCLPLERRATRGLDAPFGVQLAETAHVHQ